MTATDLERLLAAMEEAEEEFVRIRDEEPRRLQAAYREAAEQGDVTGMMEIQRQLDEHPDRLTAARIAYLQAQVAYYSAATKVAYDELRAHRPHVEAAVAALKEAEKQLAAVRHEASRLDQRYEVLKDHRNRARLELEDLVAEAAKPKGRLFRFAA